MQLHHAKVDERIWILFGWRPFGPKEYCIRWGSQSPSSKGVREALKERKCYHCAYGTAFHDVTEELSEDI